MSMTKHIEQRMIERNISETMIQFAEIFGAFPQKGDKIILDKKEVCILEKELRKILKHLEALKKRGGLTLIEDGGVKVTTYFNDSYKKNLRGFKK